MFDYQLNRIIRMIPERIKKARIDKNWSLKDLASESSVAYEQISRYESGKSQPSKSVLLRLALALNVTVEFLEGRTDIKYHDLIPGPADDQLESIWVQVKSRNLSARDRRLLADLLNLFIRNKAMEEIVLKDY